VRAAHASDGRGGNNYRYQRALKADRDEAEHKAQQKKSDDFYRKIGVLRQKSDGIDPES
tara:strand:- start:529 stop:705 length:177 start_codon:yes stop_codon:yes gene_type:complete